MDFALTEHENLKFKISTLEFKIEQIVKTVSDESVTTKIDDGIIKGSKRLSIYNRPYYSFERIPYAEPPVGALRFRAPTPKTPWKDVKDCTWYGPKALQHNAMDPTSVEGSEDCLFVNVYTNNWNPSKLRPVMVYIHGGGFYFGEANREWTGPDYFMEQDVILMTVQYRLGALGFLSFNDPSLRIPGNAGLKDIVLALKWVKKNAESFGGDPNCVTIFGESAGAAVAHYMLVTEQAKGLFHRAILQSGTAIGDWAICSGTTELAKYAGYQGENQEHLIVEYLQNLTGVEILQAESKCVERKGRELFAFAPCIEPYTTDDTVMDKPIEELIPLAWTNSIPVILGANSFEGLFFEKAAVKNETHILKALETCADYVPQHATRHIDSPAAKAKGMQLRKIHVTGNAPTLQDYYEIISFSYFWHPIQKTIDARLKYAPTAATYLYRFDFKSNKILHPYSLMYSSDRAVGHTAELAFLFANVLAKPMERNSREFLCMQQMISLWTQFAETGDPNGTMAPVAGIKWHPLSQRSEKDQTGGDAAFKCLNINDQLTFIDLPEMKKLQVWRNLYDNE